MNAPAHSGRETASGDEALRGVNLVFYDGVCALCNGVVRFLIRRDRQRRFRYASLQSSFALRALAPHGIEPGDLDAMALLEDFRGKERVHQGARAALRIAEVLGGAWGLLRPLGWLPDVLLNLGYGLVARTRYRIFGRYASCPIPTAEDRRWFVDPPAESSEGS